LEEEVKRITLVTLSVLIVLSLLLSACAPASKPKVRIATNAEFAPFEFVDEQTKELSGFDMDLIRAIATKAGFEVDIVNTGFDAMLAGLTECQYDGAIAAITITADRQAQMLFSTPYINAGQVVVVKIDNTTINSKDDLAGKTIGAQTATTGAEEAKKIADAKIKTYDSYELGLLDLGNGQIDAVIVDYPTAVGFIAKNPDKLKTVGTVFTDENYGIALCKTKTDLQTQINTALKALIDDGTVKTLEQKWLTK
jgi:polar amino acid transport system substrate-binding protein